MLFSTAGYLLFRFWFPLAPNFDQVPQFDIRSLSPSLPAGFGYGLLLCVLFWLYWQAFCLVRRLDRPLSHHFLFGTTLLFGLILINTYPINATDVYRYVISGRVKAVYGKNQFAVPPASFAQDPFTSFAGEWAGETSPYGPLWELTTTAVATISRDNLFLGLLLFKSIGLVMHLGSGTVIYRLQSSRRPSHRMANTLLWCWNPALLLTFVVNAHNDGMMLFGLLSGIWLMRRKQATTGFLVMVLAVLTKPIVLLALPFFFMRVWQQLPDRRAQVKFTAVSVVGSVALVWLAFLPFGPPLDLIMRLMREASDFAGFSVMALILLLTQEANNIISPLLLIQISQWAFGLFFLRLMWQTANGRSPLQSIRLGFAAYIAQALNFRLWYATWLFPWALIETPQMENGSYQLRTSLWFLLTTQLSPIIYGHLRVYAFGENHLLAHFIGVPFTFGLPFLLAGISGRYFKSLYIPFTIE